MEIMLSNGNNVEQWKEDVKKYINNEIRQGKDIQFTASDGDILTITSNTAGKATFRNKLRMADGRKRAMTDDEFASKLRAETHIDELSQVSERGEKTVPDYKHHSFAKDGFNYRTAYFEDVDGQYYKVTISVGINGSVNSVYNVGKMQNKKARHPLVAQRPSGKTALDSLANTNISQDNNGVNSHSMQKDEKGTNIKYMINEDFNKQYDEWDKKRHTTFKIGTTSSALQSIGVKERKILWDGTKILKILNKHKGMSDSVIKQVPHVLENPIVIVQSLQSDSRITMFGDIIDNNGVPVLAVIELTPTDLEGLVLDEIKIASAYGKDNAQSLINRSEILYVEPNKKRTNDWLKSIQLQLPSSLTNYGSINRVSYNESPVNNYDMQNDKYNSKFMLPNRNSDESDIRLYRNQQYVQEIKALNNQIEVLKQQFKITKGHKLSEKAIDGFTKRIRNKYHSDYDFDTLKSEITSLFEYIANAENVDWDNIVYQGSKMAKKTLSHSATLDDELWKQSRKFRQYLKTTPISFSENQKKEIANYYGSFESFRKSLFGSMNITDSGIKLGEMFAICDTCYHY